MKLNAKKGIFLLMVCALFGGWAYGLGYHEKATPILKNTVLRADNVSAESEEEVISSSVEENTDPSSVSASTETIGNIADDVKVVVGEDGKIYLEYTDTNGNGIPDSIESLTQSDSTNMIFSVSLGTIIGLIVSAIGLVMNWQKTRTLGKNVTSIATQSTESVETFKNQAISIADQVKTVVASVSETYDKYTAMVKETDDLKAKIEELTQANESLTKGYSSVSSRLDAILNNQAVMCQTEESVSLGINEKVQGNVTEAINYGKETKD